MADLGTVITVGGFSGQSVFKLYLKQVQSITNQGTLKSGPSHLTLCSSSVLQMMVKARTNTL